MSEYNVELYVEEIFIRYDLYKKLLEILKHNYNHYPYQSGNLMIRENSSHSNYTIPTKIALEDKYNGFIMMCNKIIDALDEDYRIIIINTYVLKKRKWWEKEFMSDSTYYRKRKAAIRQFYELYKELNDDTDE